MLPNAREDVVRRLLNSSRLEPAEVPKSRTQSVIGRSVVVSNVHRESFVHMRPNSCINAVGPTSFELVRELGEGSFGRVFEVAHKETRQTFAMKVLQKSKVRRNNALKYMVAERNILTYVRHPYIVRMHYAFQTTNQLVLVLQLCPNGNLQSLLERKRRLALPLARLYAAEVLLALVHLHERQVVYRDLKPQNVLLDEEMHALLADFGLSKEGVGGSRTSLSFCGSNAFLAPEMLRKRPHSHTVDVYGLGVLLFTVLTGVPPFFDRNQYVRFQNIRRGEVKVPDYVHEHAASLIRRTMERDPSQRLGNSSTAELKEHVLFVDLDWGELMRREVPVPRAASSVKKQSPQQASSRWLKPMFPWSSPWGRLAQSFDFRRESTKKSAVVSGWEFASPATLI